MIEMPIPNDIRKYEAKFIGPLTFRQFVCGIPAAIIFALVVALIPISDTSLKIVLASILASPFILCGFVKIQGLPFEKFAKTVFVSHYLSPSIRRYKAKNKFSKKPKQPTFKEYRKIKNRAKRRLKQKSSNSRAFK